MFMMMMMMMMISLRKKLACIFLRNCDGVMQLISFICLKFMEKFSKLNKLKEKYH